MVARRYYILTGNASSNLARAFVHQDLKLVSIRCGVRAVKEPDLKSGGILPRVFESRPQRVVLAERLRRETANFISIGSASSNLAHDGQFGRAV